MTTNEIINEWSANHPNSPYFIVSGAKCDSCGEVLTDDERFNNIIENEQQDGNAIYCAKCTE